MQSASPHLAVTLRNNREELDRRLARRQLFPQPGDGPKARIILDEFNKAETVLAKAEEFDPDAVSRRRLRQWHALIEARYDEWRAANAP